MVGGAGNDTFRGEAAHLGAIDILNGGAGADALQLVVLQDNVNITPQQVSNIETLSLTNGHTGAAAVLASAPGFTTVINNGSVQDLTVNGLSAVGAVELHNIAGKVTTIQYTEAAVGGTADTASVTLNNATGANTLNLDSATGNTVGLEKVAITSAGTVVNEVTLKTNDTAGLATVTIAGGAGLKLTLGDNVDETARTIDASAATGALAISGFQDIALGHTVTGGSGNDTFVFGAAFKGADEATVANRDVVNGGAGTDTLSITIVRAVAASAAAQTTVTSIETLLISDKWDNAQNIDVTKFADVTTLKLAGISGASTATVRAGTTVLLTTDTTANSATTFTVAGTGTTDALTLKMGGFDFLGTGAETFIGVETLNIDSGTTGEAKFENVLNITPSAGVAGANVVVTGAAGMTFTGVVTGAASIDATALTGVLKVEGIPAAAITIRGGTGNDSFKGSTGNDLLVGGAGNDSILGEDGADVIEGGAGDDTITGGSGADVLTGGAGRDHFVFASTAALNGIDTITDFAAGADGDLLNFAAWTGAAGGLNATVFSANPGAATEVAANSVVRLIDIAGGDNIMTAAGLTTALNGGEFANINAPATASTGHIFLTATSADATTFHVFFADSGASADFTNVTQVGVITGSTLAALVAANFDLT